MSRILVDQIRSNSASADAITLDGSGNLTIPGNITCSGNASVSGNTTLSGDASLSGTGTGFGIGGKLLQIVQTSDFGNQLYSTSTSYVNTGLNLDITTGSAASKLLVIANPQIGARGSSGQNAYANVALARDLSLIHI